MAHRRHQRRRKKSESSSIDPLAPKERPKGRMVFKNGKLVQEEARAEDIKRWEEEEAIRLDKLDRARCLRLMTRDEHYELFEMAGYMTSEGLEHYRRKRFYCQQFGPSLGKQTGEYLDAVNADIAAAEIIRKRQEEEERKERERKERVEKAMADAAEKRRLEEEERRKHIKVSNVDIEDDGLTGEELRELMQKELVEKYGERLEQLVVVQRIGRGWNARQLRARMVDEAAREHRLLNPRAGDLVIERNVGLGIRVQRLGTEVGGELSQWPEGYEGDGGEHGLGTVIGYRLGDGSVTGTDPGLRGYAAVRWDAVGTTPEYRVYPIGAPMELVKGAKVGHYDGSGQNTQKLQYLAHANGIADELVAPANVAIGLRVHRASHHPVPTRSGAWHLPTNDATEETKEGEANVRALRAKLAEAKEYLELRIAAVEQCPAHLETLFLKRRSKAQRVVDDTRAALRAAEHKLHWDRLYWDYDGPTERRVRNLAAGTIVGYRTKDGTAHGDVPPARPLWVTVHWDDCQLQQQLSMGEVELSLGDPLLKDGTGHGEPVYNLYASEHTGRRQMLRIQPAWRGYWGRKRAKCGWQFIHDAQRLFRGHDARRKVKRMMGIATSSEDDIDDSDDDDEDEDEDDDEGDY